MEPIELRFKYTEGEYVSAYRKYFLAKWRALAFVLIALGLIILGFYSVVAGWDVALTITFVGSGAFLFGLLMTSSFLLPLQRFRNDPRFKSEYHLRFSDNGIEFHTEDIDSRVAWRIYKEAVENKQFYFLSDGAATLTIIPKRAFTSAEQEMQFKHLLETKV